jgi:hypothetical protein
MIPGKFAFTPANLRTASADLAAALTAVGVPLSDYRRHERITGDISGGERFIWYFEPASTCGTHATAALMHAWADDPDPAPPLDVIRRMARNEYALRGLVKDGTPVMVVVTSRGCEMRARPATVANGLVRAGYWKLEVTERATSDTALASALAAIGLPPLRYAAGDRYEWIFPATCQGGRLRFDDLAWQWRSEGWEHRPENGETPMAYCKAFHHNKRVLVAMVKGASPIGVIAGKHNTALVTLDMPQSKIDKVLRWLK